jgi:hypothetical protein
VAETLCQSVASESGQGARGRVLCAVTRFGSVFRRRFHSEYDRSGAEGGKQFLTILALFSHHLIGFALFFYREFDTKKTSNCSRTWTLSRDLRKN